MDFNYSALRKKRVKNDYIEQNKHSTRGSLIYSYFFKSRNIIFALLFYMQQPTQSYIQNNIEHNYM
jgi:hypothetical protein